MLSLKKYVNNIENVNNFHGKNNTIVYFLLWLFYEAPLEEIQQKTPFRVFFVALVSLLDFY